jgi:putative membrane protein
MTGSDTTETSKPATTEAFAVDEQAIYRITRPHTKLFTYYLLRALITGPAFPIAILLYYRIYRTLLFKFTGEGITQTWGRLWRKEIYLTYQRIQDIHISRDLFQRWLGLGTVHIQTASGSSKPEMSIDGLLEYEMVRDFLYSRMRGARLRDDVQKPGSPDSSGDQITPLLREIREELSAIRESLENAKK